MINIVVREEDILKLEQLRNKCMNSYRKIDNLYKTTYGEKMIDKEYIGLSLEENNKMIGGCIISSYSNYLLIKWLFIDKEYRKKGNATKILNYLENNIDLFEEYYSIKMEGVILEPYIIAEDFYKKNGYIDYDQKYLIKKLLFVKN